MFRPSVRLRFAIPIVALALILGGPAEARTHKNRVTGRFVGVNASGPLLTSSVNLGQQMSQMVASGVQTRARPVRLEPGAAVRERE